MPWGHAWRTGANEATQFVVTDDVLINGQKLAAGSYSLHTIPTKDEFTLIFNGVANQWGSFSYDATKDALRVKAKPQWVNENKEWLEYSIEPIDDSSARVNIRWEKLTVPFTVEVKDVKGLTLQKARAAVAAAKPDDAQIRAQAASYALQNKLDVEEAWGWLKTRSRFARQSATWVSRRACSPSKVRPPKLSPKARRPSSLVKTPKRARRLLPTWKSWSLSGRRKRCRCGDGLLRQRRNFPVSRFKYLSFTRNPSLNVRGFAFVRPAGRTHSGVKVSDGPDRGNR